MDPHKAGGTNSCQTCTQTGKAACSEACCSQFDHPCGCSAVQDYGTRKRSFTLSLFSSRGMQQTDGLMHCIENFACLHHLHGTIRSLYVSVYFRALGDVQQATDRL